MTNLQKSKATLEYITSAKAELTALLEKLLTNCPMEIPVADRNIGRNHLHDLMAAAFDDTEIQAQQALDEIKLADANAMRREHSTYNAVNGRA